MTRTTSALTPGHLAKLTQPLAGSRVATRSGGGGSKLSYLEAFDVKAMLIRTFGFANFSADVIESNIEKIIPDPENAKRFTVLAKCTVRLTIHETGATYTETACASQTGGQGIGEVADFAIKTAESDALKRAAIYLGTQFGLSLYNDGQTADIVRYVLDPGQAANLAEANKAIAAKQAEAAQKVQGAMKHEAVTQVKEEGE